MIHQSFIDSYDGKFHFFVVIIFIELSQNYKVEIFEECN